MTWAGEEAGTQVPRLFSCEGTVAWDFALGAGGSACISIRASLIFISLSSQFASLAFRFAVSPSLPHPRLSPCWVRGRAGAAPRLTKAAGGEGRSGREVLLGGGVSIQRSSGVQWSRRQSFQGWPGWRVAAEVAREVGGKQRIPAQAGPTGPPTFCPQIGELCLAFPKGLGRQLCRGDPFFSPSSLPFTILSHLPTTHTPFRAVAQWFLGC